MNKIKTVIAVSGASGMIYAQRIIKKLQQPEINSQIQEVGLVFSKTAEQIMKQELSSFCIEKTAFTVFDLKDFSAPFASGSAGYDAVIIAPCSMGMLGRIAAGISNDLITRAADVMLKERKKLILLTREMPFSLIHLENMTRLTRAGALIYPASPHFYNNPASIEDLVDTVVDRILEAAGFVINYKRWGNEG